MRGQATEFAPDGANRERGAANSEPVPTFFRQWMRYDTRLESAVNKQEI